MRAYGKKIPWTTFLALTHYATRSCVANRLVSVMRIMRAGRQDDGSILAAAVSYVALANRPRAKMADSRATGTLLQIRYQCLCF